MLSHPPAIRAFPRSSQPLAATIRPYTRAFIRLELASHLGVLFRSFTSPLNAFSRYKEVGSGPEPSPALRGPYIRSLEPPISAASPCRGESLRILVDLQRVVRSAGAPFDVFLGCNFSPCRQGRSNAGAQHHLYRRNRQKGNHYEDYNNQRFR